MSTAADLAQARRQVGGTQASGNIYRGRQKSLATNPSIPSRFETLFRVDEEERKGFNTGAVRFGHETNDLPGPGRYYTSVQGGLVKDSPSYSCKGNGVGFVSQAVRFKPERQKSLGPGSYQLTNTEKYFNRAATTRAFHNPIAQTSSGANKKNVRPGPAQYNISKFKSITDSKSCVASASFRSGSRNDAPRTDHSQPSPGQYNIASKPASNVGGATAAFRSKTGRHTSKLLSTFGNHAVQKQDDTPGPATYTPRLFTHRGGGASRTLCGFIT